jgi:hypothetical protein
MNQNTPTTPDYEFWSQMSGWTVAEAAALLLDVDPDRLPENFDEPETLGWKHRRLLRLLSRAEEMDELSSPMAPWDFLTWALSNKLSPPAKLEETVRSGNSRQRNWRKKYFRMKKKHGRLKERIAAYEKLNDEPKTRVRRTLLHLIGGMARAKFGHTKDPKGTVKRIENALMAVEWPLTNNTIREYLGHADEVYEEERPVSNEI